MNKKSHLWEENKTSQLIIKIYLELPQEIKEDTSRNGIFTLFCPFFLLLTGHSSIKCKLIKQGT